MLDFEASFKYMLWLEEASVEIRVKVWFEAEQTQAPSERR